MPKTLSERAFAACPERPGGPAFCIIAAVSAIRPLLVALVALGVLLCPDQGKAKLPLRIIAINDFHGHLEAGDGALTLPDPARPDRSIPVRTGGLAHLATLVRQFRSEVPRSVFVSAGDLIGASPLVSALFRDEPTIETMNLLGLDLNAAGNHEFDHGVTELRRMIGGGCAPTPRGSTATCAAPQGPYPGANFPFIASNVVDGDGRALLPASHVVDVDGVRVAFIGAVTQSTPGIVMPTGIQGWRFLPEAESINREAARLRADGIHAQVAVVHEGGEADGGINDCRNPRGPVFDIARRLDPAIALVLSAHTHRAYNCRIDDRIVIQAASFGRLVSVIDLELLRTSGEIDRRTVVARNVPVPNGLPPAAGALDADSASTHRSSDPALGAYAPPSPASDIAALVAHYRERAAPLANQPLGRIVATFDRRPAPGGDHAAGRLLADAQLAATRIHGAQLAFTNPGGVRSDLLARPPDGVVTFGDAFAMQPFGNTLVTLTLTGAQLHQLLEDQWSSSSTRARILQPSRGFGYAWRAASARGRRIDPASLHLDGAPVLPRRRYRVTVNSYLAAGGDGFTILRDGVEPSGGPLDVDALADYLRAQATNHALAPDRVSRIRRLP